MSGVRDPYENSAFYTCVSAGCAVLAYNYPPGPLEDNLIKALLWTLSWMLFAAVNKTGLSTVFALLFKK